MAIANQKGDRILGALKAARQSAGLSQRALSARAGLAQSHVSEIENGSKDPGLSKLIDMARALDLELVLVPRRMLPAVQSLIRPYEDERRSPAYALAVIDKADRLVKKRQALHGPNVSLDRMRDALKFLRHAPVRPEDITRIKDDAQRLRRLQASPQDADDAVRIIADGWTALRNRLARGLAEKPRPAFALDEDEDEDG